MPVLEWDKSGEKLFQTGVDRGVLYRKDGTSVVWNGITGVDEDSSSERTSYYMDGVKFLEHVTPGEFAGNLKAYTYPDEFDELIGVDSPIDGLSYHEQQPKLFDLSYRTILGNDVLSTDFGYKIHLFYNLLAKPSSKSFATLNDQTEPVEFSWELSGVPPSITGHRPTVHISIDSLKTSPAVLAAIERILYGTSTTEPRLPSITEVDGIFRGVDSLIITSHGDGLWTATETLDGSFIEMLDASTFQISDADAIFVEPYTYQISDTYVHNADQSPVLHITFESPNGSMWLVTATNDGTLDISATPNDPLATKHLKLQDVDDVYWMITATDDGTLEVTTSDSDDPYLSQVRLLSSTEDVVYILTVTTDGYLDLVAE